MIKKIIHIADIHIRTYRQHNEYKEVFIKFLEEITEFAKDYSYDEIRIVIVGDLVHQKITISNEQLTLTCWLLGELAKIGKVIVVAGNHDLLENNRDRMDSITPMITLLDNDNISFFKESQCYLDENVVWCNYSIFQHNEAPDIQKFRDEHAKDDLTYIGLYHAPLVGASTDIGYEFQEGVTLEHFDGCDMALLGDIHKRQTFYYKKAPIAYPSSLIQQNYGESVSKHGYLIWDVESRTYLEFDLDNRYGFYKFKITSLEDIENDGEVLLNP